MVGQGQRGGVPCCLTRLQHSVQRLFQKLTQVVDLLQLASRILVDLAFTREDVQRLQQLGGLAGAQVELRTGVWSLGGRGAFRFSHASLPVR